jgi:hypothetical protein
MEIAVAVIALCVAMWQLKLQREEIRLNSRVNSLIHIASLLKNKIEHYEQIIEGQKTKKADWSGHAHRVNNELRPLLDKINGQLILAVSNHVEEIDVRGIREALKLSAESNTAQQ